MSSTTSCSSPHTAKTINRMTTRSLSAKDNTVPPSTARNNAVAIMSAKIREIHTSTYLSRVKLLNSFFKFIIRENYIPFIKQHAMLLDVVISKARQMSDYKVYLTHLAPLEEKVALIKTSKKFLKALLS